MNNKTFVFSLLLFVFFRNVQAQVTELAPGDYKNMIVPHYGYVADYSRCLILLHEQFESNLLEANFAIGTLTALRGASGSWNRINIAQINSSAAYNTTSANVISNFNNAVGWKLKSCRFNGKKYLALDVPYTDSWHGQGFKFSGWHRSTGGSLVVIAYEISGAKVNQDVLSEIADFVPNVSEQHDVPSFSVTGNVGIGVLAPNEKLMVDGKVRAREVRVDSEVWPDFVFEKDYAVPSLGELEDYIRVHKHLPGMPSAKVVEKEGVQLGEMSRLLLKSLEELTLQVIELKKEFALKTRIQQTEIKRLQLLNKHQKNR